MLCNSPMWQFISIYHKIFKQQDGLIKASKPVIIYMRVKVLFAQSCLTLCDPMNHSPPDPSIHGILRGIILGVGCHVLLHGIFPTQGLNLSLPTAGRFLSVWATREAQNVSSAFPLGNRTLVSRLTGGDTHHYTNRKLQYYLYNR